MKRFVWGVLVVVLVAVTCSGWTITIMKSRVDAKNKELVDLQSSFAKQYGTDGISITQLVSPDKVYAAVWTSKDGTNHVSWCIAGIWVTVFSESPTEDTQSQGE